jgi:hypothetical protein
LSFCFHPRCQNLNITLLSKRPHRLVVHVRSALTCGLVVLRRTLLIHVVLEVAIDARLVCIRKAVLLLEVAVAEIVAVAGVDD